MFSRIISCCWPHKHCPHITGVGFRSRCHLVQSRGKLAILFSHVTRPQSCSDTWPGRYLVHTRGKVAIFFRHVARPPYCSDKLQAAILFRHMASPPSFSDTWPARHLVQTRGKAAVLFSPFAQTICREATLGVPQCEGGPEDCWCRW